MKTLLETQQGYAGSKGMEDDGSYEEKGGVEGEQGSEEVQERPANDWPLICSDYDDEKPRARSTSIPKPEVDDDDDSTIMHGNDNNLDTKDDEGIQVLDSSQNLNIKVNGESDKDSSDGESDDETDEELADRVSELKILCESQSLEDTSEKTYIARGPIREQRLRPNPFVRPTAQDDVSQTASRGVSQLVGQNVSPNIPSAPQDVFLGYPREVPQFPTLGALQDQTQAASQCVPLDVYQSASESTPLGVYQSASESTPLGVYQSASESTPLNVYQSASESTPLGVYQSASECTPLGVYQSASESTPLGVYQSASESTPLGVYQSASESTPLGVYQSASESTPLGVYQSASESTPLGVYQSASECTPLNVYQSASESTPLGVYQSASESTPLGVYQSASESTPLGVYQSASECTPLGVYQSASESTPLGVYQSASESTPLGVYQSASESTPLGVYQSASECTPLGVYQSASESTPLGVYQSASESTPLGVYQSASESTPLGVYQSASESTPLGVYQSASECTPLGVYQSASESTPLGVYQSASECTPLGVYQCASECTPQGSTPVQDLCTLSGGLPVLTAQEITDFFQNSIVQSLLRDDDTTLHNKLALWDTWVGPGLEMRDPQLCMNQNQGRCPDVLPTLVPCIQGALQLESRVVSQISPHSSFHVNPQMRSPVESRPGFSGANVSSQIRTQTGSQVVPVAPLQCGQVGPRAGPGMTPQMRPMAVPLRSPGCPQSGAPFIRPAVSPHIRVPQASPTQRRVPDGRCGVVSPAIDRLLSSESDAGYGSGGELSPRPVVGSRSAEFQQRTNHKRMRDRFPLYEEKCYGYNHILKEPYLITILKEAKETRKPDFQRIYEAGRNYLGNHLALIYEIDTDHYTSLYHAAQLYEFNEVAGFIAECLFEAQYYCSIMDGFKYRVIEETYPPYGDNIFHCLARWHSDPHATARTLAAMANTLLGVASMRDLLNEKNKEGKLPFELCPPRSALQKLLRVTGASD